MSDINFLKELIEDLYDLGIDKADYDVQRLMKVRRDVIYRQINFIEEEMDEMSLVISNN